MNDQATQQEKESFYVEPSFLKPESLLHVLSPEIEVQISPACRRRRAKCEEKYLVLAQSGSQRNALIVYRNCAVFILINIFELTQTIVLVIILTRPVKIATTYDHRPFVPKTDDLFPRRRFSRTRII